MEHRATGLSRVISAAQRKSVYMVASARNRFSKTSVLGEANVVVSLTSHRPRFRTLHAAIETIASGSTKPRQLLLWVDDEREKDAALRNPGIARLVERGLEIKIFRRIGPHSKYFPHVALTAVHSMPLVTADDDILYDRKWLGRLVSANEQYPEFIHCYRAHSFALDGRGQPELYHNWQLCETNNPSFATFLTGVSGVIYPPHFLDYLREQGDSFSVQAPTADDVWLHSRAVRYGIRVRQLGPSARMFPTIVGSQRHALWRINAPDGENGEPIDTRNDKQILACYSRSDLLRIADDLAPR